MAKKSRINRNNAILATATKAEAKRAKIKQEIKSLPIESSVDYAGSFKKAFVAMLSIQKMKRNESKTRHRRRCFVTGRPRGLTKIGLERNMFREYALWGYLPGFTKSSW